jgi:protein-disulfide isomerase
VAFNPRQVLILVAAVVVVAAAGIYYVVSRPDSVLPAGANAAAPTELMVPGPLGEMALGDPKAPGVVIEYMSMTCPHCQRFHSDVYPEFKKKYVDTGKVYFILREYPLDPLASAAIVLARCAPKERFFPLVDLMFDHQSEWAFVPNPAEALLTLLKQAGFTQESFQACLTNQPILDGVNWVRNRAEKDFGVGSTPTFFINGTKVPGEQSMAELDKLLGG